LGQPPAPMQLADLEVRARWEGGQALAPVGPGGGFRIAGLAPLQAVRLEARARTPWAALTQGRALSPVVNARAGTSEVTLSLPQSVLLQLRLTDSCGPIPGDTTVALKWSAGRETELLPASLGPNPSISMPLPPAGAELQIQASGYDERWMVLPSPNGNGTIKLGCVELRPCTRASIQVIDDQNGQPVEGALLSWGAARGRTGAQGCADLPLPAHGEALQVRHPKYIGVNRYDITPNRVHCVRLEPCASLGLKLTDNDGLTLEGARLSLRKPGNPGSPAPALLASSITRAGRERTDAAGRARLLGIAPGSWLLDIYVPLAKGAPIAPGSPTRSLPVQLGAGQELQLALKLPRRIRIEVLASRGGIPLANAHLEAITNTQRLGSRSLGPHAIPLGRTNARCELVLERFLGGPREFRLTPQSGEAERFSSDLAASGPLLLDCAALDE